MNTESIIIQISNSLKEAKIEAVLIGNAVAALQGVPVTIMDFDFLVRMPDVNEKETKN